MAILKHLFFLNQGLGLSEITLLCQVPRPNTLPHSQRMAHPFPGQGGGEEPVSQGTPSEAISRAENHLLASNHVLISQMMDGTGLVCTE